MTTIVRTGDIVYSDSCYGTPIGTERTRIFGEPKFFLNANKTILVGICGAIPCLETCEFFAESFMKVLEQYFANYKALSAQQLHKFIENFYEQLFERHPDLNENYTFSFFIKGFTLQLNVKMNPMVKRVRTVTYGVEKDLAFGSGAAWWVAQLANPNLSVEERFRYIYRLDPNSGGIVNEFDLNQLKEIKE